MRRPAPGRAPRRRTRRAGPTLDGVEETVGGEVAAVGVVPAGQRLGRDRLAGAEVDDRLEVDRELLLGDGSREVAAQVERADVGGVAGVRVGHDPLTVAFGLVHGDVGAAEEFAHPAGARRGRHPAAGLDADPHALQVDRRGQRAEDGVRAGLGHGLRREPDEQHREFVAAEPRDQVVLLDRAGQPLGDVDQHDVAGGVAERLVGLFEVVEVEQ